MTEPTEGQPALDEPKKTARRAPRRAPAKPRRARKKNVDAAELPLTGQPTGEALQPAKQPEPSPAAGARESSEAETASPPAHVPEFPGAKTVPSPDSVAGAENGAAQSHESSEAETSSAPAHVPTGPAPEARSTVRFEAAPVPAQPQPQPHAPQTRVQSHYPGRGEAPAYPPRYVSATVPPPAPAAEGPRPEPVFAEGIVEVSGKGFGFLRDPKRNFTQSPQDVFVTPEVVRKYNLRDGHWIKGEIRRGGRGPQLYRLTEINGEDPEKYITLPLFEELTVISPDRRFRLETVPERYTTRVMDLMTPIGKGQRGLIVAPPRTGKTTLLQHIADAVVKNHPETKLIILLVDERPEEVTEIRRTVPSAEMMASSNDADIKSHTRIAQLAIERAKRLVEAGKDVFVLLDSITRVGRAFNNAMGGGGRTMSGGIDARALEIPRKLFAAARNTEEAGSLTIIATALIDTGSRMDELIFQEFKGTGNMELVLDRKISDLRIYPAIDIFKSGTRRDELLIPADQLHKINVIRRGLAGHKPEEAVERLLMFVRKFPTNAQMLKEIPG